MIATENVTSFSSLGLHPTLLDVLDEIGYTKPTPIQAAFIPIALGGHDCIGQAQTGTGKTAAFSLPILQQMDPIQSSVQALVLCPTRELTEQVDQEFRVLAGKTQYATVLAVGGRPLGPQIKALGRCPQVVIGTPGRVMDLMGRRALDLSEIRFAVLDEADRMLDIGFRKDIEKILRSCSDKRQTMLLSATLPPPVERLGRTFMHNPRRIDLSSNQVVVDTIRQFYCTVEEQNKFGLLIQVLLRERPEQAIVFCRTKRGAHRLYERLGKKLPDVATIHGDLPQRTRDQVLRKLRDGRARLVIATDVVGRGIDISGISHIINYDMPQNSDDYVHRVGRTGRISSSSEGRAFTFVTPAEGTELTRVEMRINCLLEEFNVEGFTAFRAKERQSVEEDEFFEPQPVEEDHWEDIHAELA